ncbi:hypothetical protein [Pseudomonas sp. 10S4]|uniref:hypothetical protein n=1 Tax=Pseudomonas sp. 10S4 TaxID=3048583 RepID=UPI002AC90EA7|nr:MULTISPECIES: hypothetical protein [unclassified Pseudomonas]MEB0224635.1 hypothetical protein [Pseudomonas sp. 5S1]MEB0294708.1 hypothetical protein [Pseudomonas sp. 10S4]WPX16947.1 hypothetical protein RHM58_23765 [Pseudomonas sp. 10S4]
MALLSTFARKLSKGKVVVLCLLALLVFWYVTLPRVVVNYPKDGKEELRYIWNTQHRIDKGGMLPGEGTADIGHIFPDKDFFMMFDWWSDKKLRRCIDITPKWGTTTEINLDETGRIDTAKTSSDVIARLKPCKGELDPFRP